MSHYSPKQFSILTKLLISLLLTLISPFATSVHLLEIPQQVRKSLFCQSKPESCIMAWRWPLTESRETFPEAVLSSDCQLWKWIKLSCHPGECCCSVGESGAVARESPCDMIAPFIRAKHGASCTWHTPFPRGLSSPAGGLHGMLAPMCTNSATKPSSIFLSNDGAWVRATWAALKWK